MSNIKLINFITVKQSARRLQYQIVIYTHQFENAVNTYQEY